MNRKRGKEWAPCCPPWLHRAGTAATENGSGKPMQSSLALPRLTFSWPVHIVPSSLLRTSVSSFPPPAGATAVQAGCRCRSLMTPSALLETWTAAAGWRPSRAATGVTCIDLGRGTPATSAQHPGSRLADLRLQLRERLPDPTHFRIVAGILFSSVPPSDTSNGCLIVPFFPEHNLSCSHGLIHKPPATSATQLCTAKHTSL